MNVADKPKPIHILLFEDNPGYRDSFKVKAQMQRILVDVYDNAHALLEALESNPRKHKFLVLDAKAFLREGETGSPSEINLFYIFPEIARIEKKQERTIPYCINTGFADLKLKFHQVLPCEIFEKGEEDKLFSHIWATYENSDVAKLRKLYPHVYEFADAYFHDAEYQLLNKMLHKNSFESVTIADRVHHLAGLRKLLEHTLDIVHEEFLGKLPEVVESRASRASDIIHYLNDRKDVPVYIFGAAVNIIRTCGMYASHSPEQATKAQDYPTSLIVRSLFLGFFEICHWAKRKTGRL